MSAQLGLVGHEAANRFLDALYHCAPAGSFVEVRFRVSSGMGQRFHRATELERVADTIVALASRTDVYVGVIARRRRGGARGDLVGVSRVVWADCDTPQSAAALTALRLRPAMVVASGSGENCHAYWFLDEPAELERVEHLNRRLALALDADARSADAARILRPAGSLNRKHSPPVPVGLLDLRAREVTLADLERNLPEETVTESASRPSRGRARGEPVDRLLLVSPAVYVLRLTGQHVGRSRKVHCPFHEDRTPSLHAYEDPDRGWYCFGCGRGGTIYDLAALVWQRDTRGSNFLALRRELEASMVTRHPQATRRQ
jgi:hypothetical protein